jgi:predicted nucleotidyltransferase
MRGTTQNVVSAYESGCRQPSLPVLLDLIAATGHSLEANLVPTDPAKPAPLSGPLGRRVHKHRHEIKSIAGAYGAGNVRVFGSVARGVERADSDIDILLDLPAGTGLFTLGRLRRDLEELLHARVDIIPDDGLKLGARANVEPDLVAL